ANIPGVELLRENMFRRSHGEAAFLLTSDAWCLRAASEGANVKWNFVIAGCCLLLLGANVALIHQNSQLKARLALPPPSLEASAGAQVPDLRGVDPEGKPVEVLYGKDSRKVLVLVF